MTEALERGRAAYARRAWGEAYTALVGAAEAAEDLELLFTAAYMLGREEESLEVLERAHRGYLDRQEILRAARCGVWIGLHRAVAGDLATAGGWLARAQRLVEQAGRECVEQGYLLMPATFEHEARGDFAAGAEVAAEAVAFSERFEDRDLFGVAAHTQGHLLIKDGQLAAGLALLDESMVAVTTGELSPVVSGIVYCGVILACQDAYDLRRAREWTDAMSRWCESQPDLVAYSGRCQLHRAELMQLQGAWTDALEEARSAAERCVRGNNPRAAAQAVYLEGEVHRLRGDFAAAEDSYREAARRGYEPQPGLALLRLAQRKNDAAAAAIRRLKLEITEASQLAGMLPAYVEIMLAIGDLEEARAGFDELAEIAGSHESDLLRALADQARGAVLLADGDASGALPVLRQAVQAWRGLDAPYDAARARWLVGLACRELGDDDAARLELEAARDAFAELGAMTDLARVEPVLGTRSPHGLSPRELEVLRLVAGGETNKAIATQLVLSERTVDRHVSNIFAKLRVSSRAAATAYAYEHDLVG